MVRPINGKIFSYSSTNQQAKFENITKNLPKKFLIADNGDDGRILSQQELNQVSNTKRGFSCKIIKKDSSRINAEKPLNLPRVRTQLE